LYTVTDLEIGSSVSGKVKQNMENTVFTRDDPETSLSPTVQYDCLIADATVHT
tara:strand:+ start:165 stop:323 length:159 start_codon:yes stop_codon:yes gene_type:complete